MKGWKTWVGAGIVAAGAFVTALGYPDVGKAIVALGAALGLVGVAHKIEKTTK